MPLNDSIELPIDQLLAENEAVKQEYRTKSAKTLLVDSEQNTIPHNEFTYILKDMESGYLMDVLHNRLRSKGWNNDDVKHKLMNTYLDDMVDLVEKLAHSGYSMCTIESHRLFVRSEKDPKTTIFEHMFNGNRVIVNKSRKGAGKTEKTLKYLKKMGKRALVVAPMRSLVNDLEARSDGFLKSDTTILGSEFDIMTLCDEDPISQEEVELDKTESVKMKSRDASDKIGKFIKSGSSLCTTLYTSTDKYKKLITNFTRQPFVLVLEELSNLSDRVYALYRKLSYNLVMGKTAENQMLGTNHTFPFTEFDLATLKAIKSLAMLVNHENLTHIVINDADADETSIGFLQSLSYTKRGIIPESNLPLRGWKFVVVYSEVGMETVLTKEKAPLDKFPGTKEEYEYFHQTREAEVITTDIRMEHLLPKHVGSEIFEVLTHVVNTLKQNGKVICYVPNIRQAAVVKLFVESNIKDKKIIVINRKKMAALTNAKDDVNKVILSHDLVIHTTAILSGTSFVPETIIDGTEKVFDLGVYFVDYFGVYKGSFKSPDSSISVKDLMQMIWRDRTAHNIKIVDTVRKYNSAIKQYFNKPDKKEFNTITSEMAFRLLFKLAIEDWVIETITWDELQRLYFNTCLLLKDGGDEEFRNVGMINLQRSHNKCNRNISMTHLEKEMEACTLRNVMYSILVRPVLENHGEKYSINPKITDPIFKARELLDTMAMHYRGSDRYLYEVFSKKDLWDGWFKHPSSFGIRIAEKLYDEGFSVTRKYHRDGNPPDEILPETKEYVKNFFSSAAGVTKKKHIYRIWEWIEAMKMKGGKDGLQDSGGFDIVTLICDKTDFTSMKFKGKIFEGVMSIDSLSIAKMERELINLQNESEGTNSLVNVLWKMHKSLLVQPSKTKSFQTFILSMLMLEIVEPDWYLRISIKEFLKKEGLDTHDVYSELSTNTLMEVLCFYDSSKIDYMKRVVKDELMKLIGMKLPGKFSTLGEFLKSDFKTKSTIFNHIFTEVKGKDAYKTLGIVQNKKGNTFDTLVKLDSLADAQVGRLNTGIEWDVLDYITFTLMNDYLTKIKNSRLYIVKSVYEKSQLHRRAVLVTPSILKGLEHAKQDLQTVELPEPDEESEGQSTLEFAGQIYLNTGS